MKMEDNVRRLRGPPPPCLRKCDVIRLSTSSSTSIGRTYLLQLLVYSNIAILEASGLISAGPGFVTITVRACRFLVVNSFARLVGRGGRLDWTSATSVPLGDFAGGLRGEAARATFHVGNAGLQELALPRTSVPRLIAESNTALRIRCMPGSGWYYDGTHRSSSLLDLRPCDIFPYGLCSDSRRASASPEIVTTTALQMQSPLGARPQRRSPHTFHGLAKRTKSATFLDEVRAAGRARSGVHLTNNKVVYQKDKDCTAGGYARDCIRLEYVGNE
ncbi:hypothetical protein B0H13DRAFT_2516130 [Mycena leptocephala]|nr:hypothetical protein B0H13DRAFT_2516130 [Mycena leptocephala]